MVKIKITREKYSFQTEIFTVVCAHDIEENCAWIFQPDNFFIEK